MRELTLHCRSENETEAVGERIGNLATPGTVVACRGPLGAGKTTLVRGLVRGAGSDEAVTSPTFVLLHIYEGGRIPVYHFDAYRLSGPNDLLDIGCEDYFWGDGVSVVEWAERAEGVLPGDRLEVDISTVSPEERALRLKAHGAQSLKILESVR